MTDDYPVGDAPRKARGPEEREVRAEALAALWKRTALGAGGLVLLLILGGIGYLAWAIRDTQVANKPVLRDTHAAADAAVRSAADAARTANRIEDCTTPGRKCYDRAQAQTGAAVSGINTVEIRATACSVAYLVSAPRDTLTVDELTEQIKRCIQSGTIKASPVGPGSDLLPSTAPSPSPSWSPSPRPTTGPPKPAPSPTPSPTPGPPSPSPLCLLGVCLPLPVAL